MLPLAVRRQIMETRSERADVGYYTQLETGARWLASRPGAGAEREIHLGHARRYGRLRLDAAGVR
ncbi:MAG: hypothetical protein QOJ27_2314 [Sphingomonadales bacterium]|nr:hypothetical protein [Sphingomonadales bacterium]